MAIPNALLHFLLCLVLLFTTSAHADQANITCPDIADPNTGPHVDNATVLPVGRRDITVDAAGAGDFLTVQQAIDSLPDGNTERVVIHINAGTYKEKVEVPPTKPFITFEGAGREETVIEWHDRASQRGPNGQQLHTFQTASVTVFADHFIARNIGFKEPAGTYKRRPKTPSPTKRKTLPVVPALDNSAGAPEAGEEGWQAVAFRITGDKAYFYGCGFYGAQDTLADAAGRHYFKDCYIEGSIDFIFGNARSIYKNCTLHSIAEGYGSIAAQERETPCEHTGFAFLNCTVTGTGRVYAGRSMGQYARIVYAYTYFDDVMAPGGWDDWGDINNLKTAYFGVYECGGPGAEAVRRTWWAKKLDFQEAHPFLKKSFVNGRHWIDPSDE